MSETTEQVKGAPYRILNRKEIWEERRMIAKALTSQGAESIVHEHNCYGELLEALRAIVHEINETGNTWERSGRIVACKAQQAIAKAEGR